MNEHKNYPVVLRIHQLLIGVLFVFSLFVKEDVKKFFWLIIGLAALSLLIQTTIFNNGQRALGDKMNKPHE